MTYENAYSIAGTDLVDMTLYEAWKALEEIAKRGELEDITHVRRSGRAVAFWCEWRGTVGVMFEANEAERSVLSQWA